jgi:hypothetical protein
MKKITLLTGSLLLFFFSCKKEVANVDEANRTEFNAQEDRLSKIEFTKTLARALEDKEVRLILKQEALKKFDNDYDVLYGLSKDITAPSGKTLHELVSAHATDKEHFNEIIQNLPLLTIYVPQLDQFDAEKWNVDQEIPIVALRDINDRKSSKPLLAYGQNDNIIELNYTEKPKNPVVVVKDNERVETSDNEQRNGTEKNARSGNTYRATDIAFKNSEKLREPFNSVSLIAEGTPRPPRDSINRPPATRDSSIYVDNSQQISVEAVRYAYEKKLESQRDYVYYGIDPSTNVNSGSITNRYAEHIVSLEMENEAALQKITDDWTDGNLEIVINVITISRDGSTQSVRKAVNCSSQDLRFDETQGLRPPKFYRAGSKVKEYFLPSPLEIERWDVYKYGEKWKFVVSEFDPGTETTTNTTVSSEFSANFNGNVGIEIPFLKIGIGGGGTSKETKSTSVTVKTTDVSDDLYEGILNFYTPVYSRAEYTPGRGGSIIAPKAYTVNTGLIRLRVEPLEI